jgi:response regulator of citrate/malate metabolism
MASMTLTTSEILEAIRAALPEVDDNASTAEELSDELGVHRSTVNRKLKPMVKSGQLRVVTRTVRDTFGRLQRVPGYVLND